MTKGPICEFGNASPDEVVEVEWDRAIRNCFVSDQKKKKKRFFWIWIWIWMSFLILEEQTHTWFSGRTTFSPSGVSNSWTLENNQSLAANPPTSTTCWKIQIQKKNGLKNDILKKWRVKRLTETAWCALFFCSRIALTIQSIDGWKNWATSVLKKYYCN